MEVAIKHEVFATAGDAWKFDEVGKNRTCSDCGYRPTNDGSSVCERCLADDWA